MRFLSRVALVLVCAVTASAQTISTPEQLITAMHNRYSSKWYHTLSFDQQSITHKPDGTDSTELWYEALLLPGRLRIDIGSPKSGNGMLFVNNHLYLFHDGKLAGDRDLIHPLLVLGFDVYTQPVNTTLQQLKDLHVDMTLFHEENFEGRPTYVVGARQGDLKTRQFWVDKQRLYFVRLLEPSEKHPESMQDSRFEEYKQVAGGGWVAEHVTDRQDGKLVFEERYSNVQVNPALNDSLFDPKNYGAAGATPAK